MSIRLLIVDDQELVRTGFRLFLDTQDEFEAELAIDRQGLVLEYDGLWRAIATT